MGWQRVGSLTVVLLLTAVTVRTEQLEPVRSDSSPPKIQNDHAAFSVRVDVDKPDRVYYEGEQLVARVRSSRDGYLFLFNYRPDGTVQCIFPNAFQKENRIRAGEEVIVPAPEAPFVFRIRPPFGEEILQAVVCLEAVPPQQLGVASLTEQASTPVPFEGVKAICPVEKPQSWAEHSVQVETRPLGKEPQPKHKRIALLIGVGKFQDSRIRPLEAPAHDVELVGTVFRDGGRFDEVITLVDENATYRSIQEHICELLPAATVSGDVIVIYFTGHGGRCADDNGDEQDGLDEYLVPYDGQYVEPWKDQEALRNSMILDDTFARWVQCLDGRQVVVIIDACYSGGHTALEKGLPPLIRSKPTVPSTQEAAAGFDFVDDIREELTRVKNLGQEVVLLASCSAQEIAVVDRPKPVSVMTAFLTEYLERTAPPVTVRQAADYVIEVVPAYVRKHYPGVTQTPYLVGEEAAEQICLKPAASF